ncbi:MAG: HEAT repeat domain-containing protein [Spirochaetaceae bacterium]|nr:HEAT repeat domain-containing protein [Spirochaetaceae bacterium]
MRREEYLLSDEQVRGFITDGYVQVQTGLDESVHRTIFEKTDRILSSGDGGRDGGGANPQNNILPVVGELAQVLEAPEVVGALTSILGEGYVMLPHRHCHLNAPVEPLPDGRRGITMVPHRDGQAGCHKPRHRVPQWALLFYYPQECPDRQGPTALIPGTHLLPRLTTELDLEMPLAVDRGTGGGYRLPANYVQREVTSLACGLGAVSIMHFDLGHSVLTNVAEEMRYGHKFVFMRTEQPTGPSWANREPYWRPSNATGRNGDNEHADNEIAWTYVWNWMAGAGDLFRRAPGEAAAARPGTVAELRRRLRSAEEAERRQAANALGFARAAAAPAVAALVAALEDDSQHVQLNACYALGAVGADAVESLVAELDGYEELYRTYPPYGIGHAAHALGAVGAPAVPALVRALRGPHDHVRANAAYALGEIGHRAAGAMDALADALDNSADEEVRRHLLSAISLVGHPQERALAVLAGALQRESNSQFRQLAIQGMARLNGPQDAAVPALAAALSDSDPYVAAYASEQLCRIGTPAALAAAVGHLRRQRWFGDAPLLEPELANARRRTLDLSRVVGRR